MFRAVGSNCLKLVVFSLYLAQQILQKFCRFVLTLRGLINTLLSKVIVSRKFQSPLNPRLARVFSFLNGLDLLFTSQGLPAPFSFVIIPAHLVRSWSSLLLSFQLKLQLDQVQIRYHLLNPTPYDPLCENFRLR